MLRWPASVGCLVDVDGDSKTLESSSPAHHVCRTLAVSGNELRAFHVHPMLLDPQKKRADDKGLAETGPTTRRASALHTYASCWPDRRRAFHRSGCGVRKKTVQDSKLTFAAGKESSSLVFCVLSRWQHAGGHDSSHITAHDHVCLVGSRPCYLSLSLPLWGIKFPKFAWIACCLHKEFPRRSHSCFLNACPCVLLISSDIQYTHMTPS